MYKWLFSFLMTFLIAFPFLSFAHCDNSLKEFKGRYAYQIAGEFGPISLSQSIVETGIFKSNGKGRITAHADAVINGHVLQNATYDGTYTVSNHVAHVNITRTTQSGSNNLTFTLSLGEQTDTAYIQAIPEPSTSFSFTNVKGTASK
jgi:hypothetical protein